MNELIDVSLKKLWGIQGKEFPGKPRKKFPTNSRGNPRKNCWEIPEGIAVQSRKEIPKTIPGRKCRGNPGKNSRGIHVRNYQENLEEFSKQSRKQFPERIPEEVLEGIPGEILEEIPGAIP